MPGSIVAWMVLFLVPALRVSSSLDPLGHQVVDPGPDEGWTYGRVIRSVPDQPKDEANGRRNRHRHHRGEHDLLGLGPSGTDPEGLGGTTRVKRNTATTAVPGSNMTVHDIFSDSWTGWRWTILTNSVYFLSKSILFHCPKRDKEVAT